MYVCMYKNEYVYYTMKLYVYPSTNICMYVCIDIVWLVPQELYGAQGWSSLSSGLAGSLEPQAARNSDGRMKQKHIHNTYIHTYIQKHTDTM